MKEIIIIETNKQGSEATKFRKKVKDFLNKTDANYQMYQVQDELSKEERWKRDWELASKDKTREKEVEWWDKISDEDDLEQMKNEKGWNFS